LIVTNHLQRGINFMYSGYVTSVRYYVFKLTM